MRKSRFGPGARCALVVAFVGVVLVPGTAPASEPATTTDLWSSKVDLRTPDGWWASPIHSALLPDGRVLLWGLQRPTDATTPATRTKRAAWILTPGPVASAAPSAVTVTPIEEPVEIDLIPTADGYIEDDLYCSGHALTVDGVLFTAGGTHRQLHTGTPNESTGVDYQTVFDWQTATWNRLAARMQGTSGSGGHTRWYPTVTKLPDGRMLIQGGFDKVLPAPTWNGTAEVWDPNTGTNVVISPYGWTPPELMNSSYTHAFVLPTPVDGHQLLEFGETGVPVLMNLAGPTALWRVLNTNPRPGSEAFNQARVTQGRWRWESSVAPDWGASSAMLEIRLNNGAAGYTNGAVTVAGGPPNTAHIGDIDSYDPVLNAWRPGGLLAERNFPMTVNLPDGRLLVVGGAGTLDPNIRRAEYLDPLAGFSETLGTADGGDVRGYHATSVLLPDGRVLVAGGRDISKSDSYEKPSFRYYYPDYMTKDRPRLYAAPQSLNPGTPYAVWTNRPAQELVLVALGSQTHSIDFNQRAVQVPVLGNIQVNAQYNVTIGGALPDARTLPPGYYMLFAVDDQRVPSAAKIVKVNAAAP